MKTIIYFVAVFLLQWACIPAKAQSITDSLIKEISYTKDDTAKARLYKKITEQYSTTDPKVALQYAETGLKHVTDMGWNKGVAVFNNLIGALYSNKAEYNVAIEKYTRAYTIHVAEKDDYNASSALNNIGTAYLRQAIYDKATAYYFEAMKLAEKIDNKYMIANCLGNIASVYFNQNNYDKSLEYEFKALPIRKAENDKAGTATSYLSVANSNQNKKDTLNAKKYYLQALEVYQETANSEGIATVYSNLSLLLADNKQKLDYQLKAQAIWNELNPSYTISLTNMGNIAYSYMDLSRIDKATRNEALYKAKEWLDKGILLCNKDNDIGNYTFLLGARSEWGAMMGDYKNAYDDKKKFHELNDSIYSQDSKNKIAAIEGQREVVIRDKEIELNKLALYTQKKQRIALLAGVVLLGIIGVLLYRQNRLRKKTNSTLQTLNNDLLTANAELDEANKLKAKFFAILTHDLRSPVAYLIDFLHLQKTEPGLLSEQQTEIHQQKITASAEALLQNMETMLLWSKEQMQNFKPQINTIAVNTLFDHISRSFTSASRVTITCSNPQNLSVTTDENYLQTIMYNLTSNAIKALENTDEATINWEAFQQEGKTRLRITDNGPGISDAVLQTLFNDKIVANGATGFGLHLIKDLAKAIQCNIKAVQQTGGGTSFELFA